MLRNACTCVDIDPLLLNNRTLRGFDRLARFAGSGVPSHDTKLAQCLDQVTPLDSDFVKILIVISSSKIIHSLNQQVTNDWHAWGGLVQGLAVGFIAEWWKGTSYLMEHDAFLGNEQLVIQVLGEILHIMKVSRYVGSDNTLQQFEKYMYV